MSHLINMEGNFHYFKQMSAQKFNIRLPERISLSQLVTSKPCPPIPIPTHILNQINNRSAEQVYVTQPQPINNGFINQTHVMMNPQLPRNSMPPLTYYSHASGIPPNMQYQIPKPISPISTVNQYPQQHIPVSPPRNRQHHLQASFRSSLHSQSPVPINFKNQVQQKDNRNHPHSSSNSKIRPKSPKIQFKYVSPPKKQGKLEQIKQVTDSNAHPNPNGNLDASQQLNLKNNRFSEYKKQNNSNQHDISEELEKLQNQIVNSSLKNSVPQKSSITNYIYLVQNKNIKDSQQTPKPNQNTSSQKPSEREITSNQQPKTYEINIKEEEASDMRGSNNEMKLKLKNHDDQLNEMMKQYEYLKYYHDNDNSSNRLPRVSKNSSDDEASYSRSGLRSAGNSSIKNQGKMHATFGVIEAQQPEEERPDNPIRIKQDKRKKRQSIRNMIKQETSYMIEGIENVKSEVLDIDSNETREKPKQSKLNSTQRQYKWEQNENETANSQFNYKLRQKQLEVKNLKNQVWLMKLRESQLLQTIKKLQAVTKDQQALISKLSKSK